MFLFGVIDILIILDKNDEVIEKPIVIDVDAVKVKDEKENPPKDKVKQY